MSCDACSLVIRDDAGSGLRPVRRPFAGGMLGLSLARAMLGLSLALGVVASGCKVAPLYGRGAPVSGAVLVDPVETRVAQRVRNGLIEELGVPRTGNALRLSLDVTSSVDLSLTDLGSDRATAGAAVVEARYQLSGTDGLLIAEGRERARASFDAPRQEFARQRAIRDAENRAAREAATQIRLAISPAIASAGPPSPPEEQDVGSAATGSVGADGGSLADERRVPAVPAERDQPSSAAR